MGNGTFVTVGRSGSPGLTVAGLSSTSAIACYPGSYTPKPALLRQLVCTSLTIDLTAQTVIAGPETDMREDNVQMSGTGDGHSESSNAGSMIAARMSDSTMILCYQLFVSKSSATSYAKTLCNHVTGSSLKLGPSYEIGGYSFDRHIVVLPGSSTAVVCYKECHDNMHPKGCLKTGSMGVYDTCRDVHLTENSCSVGSAWMSTRASYREAVNLVFDVTHSGTSQVLACSGNSNNRGCDTLVVDNSRTSCPVFCESSLGACTSMGLITTAAPKMHGGLSGCANTKLGLLLGYFWVLFLVSVADA